MFYKRIVLDLKLSFLLLFFSPYHNHARKRRGVFRVRKVQPPFDEPNLGFAVNIFVEPARVRARRNERNADRCPGRCTFLNPQRRRVFSIRRIAKHPFAFPVLYESVVFLRVELLTFGILFRRTRVKVELELFVERVKKRPRCFPLRRITRE